MYMDNRETLEDLNVTLGNMLYPQHTYQVPLDLFGAAAASVFFTTIPAGYRPFSRDSSMEMCGWLALTILARTRRTADNAGSVFLASRVSPAPVRSSPSAVAVWLSYGFTLSDMSSCRTWGIYVQLLLRSFRITDRDDAVERVAQQAKRRAKRASPSASSPEGRTIKSPGSDISPSESPTGPRVTAAAPIAATTWANVVRCCARHVATAEEMIKRLTPKQHATINDFLERASRTLQVDTISQLYFSAMKTFH